MYNKKKAVNICKALGLTYIFCRNSGNKIKSALHMRAIQLIFSKGGMELIRKIVRDSSKLPASTATWLEPERPTKD